LNLIIPNNFFDLIAVGNNGGIVCSLILLYFGIKVVWKSTLFIIFIVFICQKFSRIPLFIEKYNNVVILEELYL